MYIYFLIIVSIFLLIFSIKNMERTHLCCLYKICNKTHTRKIFVFAWKSPVFNNLFFYPIYLQHDFDVQSTFSEIITMLLENSRSKMWFRTNVVNPLCLLGLNSTNFVCISFELDSGQLLPRISIGSGIVCRVRHSKE